MGVVRFSEYEKIAGSYDYYQHIYKIFYCDDCGSFSIKPHTQPYTNIQITAKGLLIVETPLIAALAWVTTHNWILCSVLFMVGLIIFVSISKEMYLMCRKCGNKQITNEDVLNYSKKKYVIDVPKELCVIEYEHTIAPLM